VIEAIKRLLQNDARLMKLFGEVHEYAALYLLAKQRQRGCDGMGEVATLKDELAYFLEKMFSYCKEKSYLSDNISYEIDSIAYDICEVQPK